MTQSMEDMNGRALKGVWDLETPKDIGSALLRGRVNGQK